MSTNKIDGEGDKNVDLATINTPVELCVTGVSQIIRCLQSGTPEICYMLMEECDVILECKVCRSLFRGIPNFLAHKQSFCQQHYKKSRTDIYYGSAASEVIMTVNPESPDDSTPIKNQASNHACSPSPTKLMMRPPNLEKVLKDSSACSNSFRAVACESPRELRPVIVKLEEMEGLTCAVKQKVISSKVTGTPPRKPNSAASSTTSKKLAKNNNSASRADDTVAKEKSAGKSGVFFRPKGDMDYRKMFASNTNCDLKNMRCVPCDKSYDSFRGLKFHMISLHMRKKRFWKCPECSKQFHLFHNMTTHLERTHKITTHKVEKMKSDLQKTCLVSRTTGQWNGNYNCYTHVQQPEKGTAELRKFQPSGKTSGPDSKGTPVTEDIKSSAELGHPKAENAHRQPGKCWQCFKCKQQFKMLSSMMQHMRKFHNFKHNKKFQKNERLHLMLNKNCYIGPQQFVEKLKSGLVTMSEVVASDTQVASSSKIKSTSRGDGNMSKSKPSEAAAQDTEHAQALQENKPWKCVFCHQVPRYFREFRLFLKHARRYHQQSNLSIHNKALKKRSFVGKTLPETDMHKIPHAAPVQSKNNKSRTDSIANTESRKTPGGSGSRKTSGGNTNGSINFNSGFSLHRCEHCNKVFAKHHTWAEHVKVCEQRLQGGKTEAEEDLDKPNGNFPLESDKGAAVKCESSADQNTFLDKNGSSSTLSQDEQVFNSSAKSDGKEGRATVGTTYITPVVEKQCHWRCIFCAEPKYFTEFHKILKHAESVHKIHRSLQLEQFKDVWKQKAYNKVPVACEWQSGRPVNDIKSLEQRDRFVGSAQKSVTSNSSNAKSQSHRCPHCRHIFPDALRLCTHMFGVNADSPAKPGDPMYQCTHCDFRHHQRSGVSKHHRRGRCPGRQGCKANRGESYRYVKELGSAWFKPQCSKMKAACPEPSK